MKEDRIYKVFISYSWNSNFPVMALAEQLCFDGIDVVLDKWDLKEGQDKYVFMEQCVSDPDITKVLIICDKTYAEKANNRSGGVGDETAIISGEIYGKTNQEKFIPIVVEYDEAGNPCLPAYIKTRLYINLSNDEHYQEEYEKLVRNIYGKPLYRKPELGVRPSWIDEERTNLFPLTNLISQIKGSRNATKQKRCVMQFIDKYIATLKNFFPKSTDGQTIYNLFVDMKDVRDVFLDFLSVLDDTELSSSEIIGDAFEKIHNSLTTATGFNPNAIQAKDRDYDIYHIHIWELFICVITYYRYLQNFTAIHDLLTRTYFLTESSLGNDIAPTNYYAFYHYSAIIEEEYKPNTGYKAKLTLSGHTLCTNREKLPVFASESIAESDLFLYQIGKAFTFSQGDYNMRRSRWFPICYVYARKSPDEWIKMKSRKYCQKIYPLFGVKDLDELKDVLKNCTFDRDMGYSRADPVPAILSFIKLEDVGSLE